MADGARHIGVILMNTGTPDSPEPEAIRPYLAEFLTDPRIIKVPKPIWMPILYGIILRKRPQSSAEKYRRVWTPEGSPLIIHSRAQGALLQGRLDERGLDIKVEVGQRYGNPSIAHAYGKLVEAGCTHILGLPLYPQTAFTQVYTCADEVKRVNRSLFPDTISRTFLDGYAGDERYIAALAKRIRDTWNPAPGSKLLFTFHSIPTKDVEQGDTYPRQVEETARLLTDELGLTEGEWALAYHSRFEDSRKWLTPSPERVIARWMADGGCTNLAVVTPGFASDCLESLYDCDVELREYYGRLCQEAGIEGTFTYIPALNDMPEHIDVLEHIVEKQIEAFTA